MVVLYFYLLSLVILPMVALACLAQFSGKFFPTSSSHMILSDWLEERLTASF